MGLEAVNAAKVGEEEQVGVRGRGDDVRDVVLVAELSAGHPAATTALALEGVERHRLYVALGGHGDDEVLIIDEVLDIDIPNVIRDLGTALGCVLVSDSGELVFEHSIQDGAITEDGFVLRNTGQQLFHLGLKLGATQPRETVELHGEDELGLHLAELERSGFQRDVGRGLVL